MKNGIFLFTFIFTGCVFSAYEKKINKHFLLSSFDDRKRVELLYINNEDFMFVVVGKGVTSFAECGNYIFIKQQPNNKNEDSTQFYIVDINVDYSNERLKPVPPKEDVFADSCQKLCSDIRFELVK